MVPKIIHQIVGKQPSELVAKCVQSWQILQEQGIEFMRWDDTSLGKFIMHFYPMFYNSFNNARNHSEASDIARYLLVYHYGGHFIDWDIELLSPGKFIELDQTYPFGYLVQDPVNQSLASEAFSGTVGEQYLYNIVDNIAYIFENGYRDSLGMSEYSGPYRMREVYYSTKKNTKQIPVIIKDVFLYDYWEIREKPPRDREVAMLHYWEHAE